MNTRNRFFLPLVAGLVLVSALVVAACGDDDDDGGSSGAVDNARVMQTIIFLDTAGLHDIDDSINESQEVPPDARAVMLKGATAIKLTTWPDDLKAAADGLAATMEECAQVLNGDPIDIARAGELAARVHDDGHTLSHDAWAHLQAEAGINAGGGDGHN